MTRTLAALVLCLFALNARAAPVAIVSQSCDVANTSCDLVGDGGQKINVKPRAATMTINGAPYAGAVTSSVLVESTTYRRTLDVTFTFTPTATVDAMHVYARSGSGRGGYQWHEHWVFTTVTVY